MVVVSHVVTGTYLTVLSVKCDPTTIPKVVDGGVPKSAEKDDPPQVFDVGIYTLPRML